MIAYLLRARHVPAPVLDFSLLALPTFRASLLGGFLFRIGVGALPFLLPLMMQLGFKLDPFQSGLVTFSAALGALTMKAVAASILQRLGFRTVLVANALVSAGFIAACAAFSQATPFAVIVAILLVGGFFRSLQFTSINAIAYAEIRPERMSRATTLTAVGQQLSLSTGVALSAAIVEFVVHRHGSTTISIGDFRAAFLLVATVSASSVLLFLALPRDAGADLSHHQQKSPDRRDQAER